MGALSLELFGVTRVVRCALYSGEGAEGTGYFRTHARTQLVDGGRNTDNAYSDYNPGSYWVVVSPELIEYVTRVSALN